MVASSFLLNQTKKSHNPLNITKFCLNSSNEDKKEKNILSSVSVAATDQVQFYCRIKFQNYNRRGASLGKNFQTICTLSASFRAFQLFLSLA
jgi:hypothetical protein